MFKAGSYNLSPMRNKIILLLILLICLIQPASADTNITNNHLQWSGVKWNWASWSSSVDRSNAWVDNEGNLHMVLRKINGQYKGCLFEAPTKNKYGRFTWTAKSTSLDFEFKSTVGFCTYFSDNSELDIEMNQWYIKTPEHEADSHLFFSNQPASVEGKNKDNIFYGIKDDSPYLHAKGIIYSITWMPTYVYYCAKLPDGTIIQEWNYTNSGHVPQVDHTVCMCLLPLGGTSGPSSGKPIELVLSSYKYETMQEVLNSQPEDPVIIPTEPEPEPTEPEVSWTEPLNSYFVYSPSGLAVSFKDQSHGSPTSYYWSFGDGKYSTEKNPSHTYSKSGSYYVGLTVEKSGVPEYYKTLIRI